MDRGEKDQSEVKGNAYPHDDREATIYISEGLPSFLLLLVWLALENFGDGDSDRTQ